jgi:hypothetical protein
MLHDGAGELPISLVHFAPLTDEGIKIVKIHDDFSCSV